MIPQFADQWAGYNYPAHFEVAGFIEGFMIYYTVCGLSEKFKCNIRNRAYYRLGIPTGTRAMVV